MTFTFLIASARKDGNSEQLARHSSKSLPQETNSNWINLREYPLPAFQDLRHDQGYQQPTGNPLKLANATLDADHLVFVTPVYWYSVPAPLKLYLDYWSHWMRVESLDFRGKMKHKTLWIISCSAGKPAEAQPMIDTLKLCANYLDMKWGGHVLGNGTAPGDILHDTKAMNAACKLFATV